LTKKIRTN